MTDAAFARHLSQFAATGRAGGVFASPEGSGLMADFSRIVLTAETARSTSFAVEAPMLLSLVQTGQISMHEAFSRESELNPLSMRGAAAANRLYESRVQDLPVEKRPTKAQEKNYQEVLRRRRALLIRYVETEMRARNLTFERHADFMLWARNELRPLIVERARQLFGMSSSERSSEGDDGRLLFGGRRTIGQA
jgi:hypothetical protein